jgi:hypothetical protein
MEVTSESLPEDVVELRAAALRLITERDLLLELNTRLQRKRDFFPILRNRDSIVMMLAWIQVQASHIWLTIRLTLPHRSSEWRSARASGTGVALAQMRRVALLPSPLRRA